MSGSAASSSRRSAIDYPAPARLPFELKQAGCEVALIAPGRIARRAHAVRRPSRDRRGPRDDARVDRAAVDREIDRVRSRDRAARRRRDGPHAARRSRSTRRRAAALAATRRARERVARRPRARTIDSIDKTRLYELARSGRHSTSRRAASPPGVDDAVAIAESLGYPVIVRAGIGSRRRRDRRAARMPTRSREAVRKAHLPAGWLPARSASPPGAALDRRPGDRARVARVARRARSRVARAVGSRRYPSTLGPGSAVVFAGIPSIAEATRTADAARSTRPASWARSSSSSPAPATPLLLEINRRMVPATYGARYAGIDQARALAATLRGERWNGAGRSCRRGRARGSRCSRRSGTAIRESAWLADLPSDAPWHDPALFRAMLRLPVDADAEALAHMRNGSPAARCRAPTRAALTSPSAAPRRTASP